MLASSHRQAQSAPTCPEATIPAELAAAPSWAILHGIEWIVAELSIGRLLHVPCGDMGWIADVDLGTAIYIGIDARSEMIAANRARYGWGNERRILIPADIRRAPLPTSDLVLARDAFGSLSFASATQAIANLKATGAGFILATTFTGRLQNDDTVDGGWRPLNLRMAPFDWPEPMLMLGEGEPNAMVPDGCSLGLWATDEL